MRLVKTLPVLVEFSGGPEQGSQRCFTHVTNWGLNYISSAGLFIWQTKVVVFVVENGGWGMGCLLFSINVFLFFFLSGISGYVSSNFYRKIGGTNWVWNVVLTTSIFSGKSFRASN